VGLLLTNVKVTIRPQPVSLSSQESLSSFDARRSAYVDRSSARSGQEVLETKEGEGRRFDRRSIRPMQQVAVEEQHCRLLGRDVQLEGCQSLFHFPPKPLRVLPILECRYEVVAVPGQLRPSSASLLEAPFKPQVQDVVQVHVRQHG